MATILRDGLAWITRPSWRGLYLSGDYLKDYARHTDLRVAADPQEAAGGLWETLGRLQLDFLRSEGLGHTHRLLDIGCGTLRAGRHFIRYLEAGNYTGTELSARAFEAARELVEREGLAGKKPRLVHVADGNFRFEALAAAPFDFLLAQSVFTHLMDTHIEQCFAHLHKVMHATSRFYFTFLPSHAPYRSTPKDFHYPFQFFDELAHRHQLSLIDLSARYAHPRQQKMVVATRS